MASPAYVSDCICDMTEGLYVESISVIENKFTCIAEWVDLKQHWISETKIGKP
jgi:hypothetical protein